MSPLMTLEQWLQQSTESKVSVYDGEILIGYIEFNPAMRRVGPRVPASVFSMGSDRWTLELNANATHSTFADVSEAIYTFSTAQDLINFFRQKAGEWRQVRVMVP